MKPGELARLLRLIVITDRELAGERGVDAVVAAALRAGARTVQLRRKDAAAGTLLDEARRLRAATRDAGALLFVNDRFDVALAAGADGVHLGPDDLPVAAVRQAVPPEFLVGYSTDEPAEAREAVAAGADYIGCGTVFPTESKADAGEVIGLGGLDAVAAAVEVPVVGIGGITPERARTVADETRAAGTAVIRAVMGARDVERAVRGLLAPFEARR